MDFSSSTSGMALLDGDDIRAERQWHESPSRNQQVFPALLALLKDGRCRPEDLDLFAVGVGPGTFSGLRVALATAQGMALPSEKPVIGVSSGEAIAWDVFRETSAKHVTIVGDARRRRLWMTTVEARGDSLPLVGEYTSIPADVLSSRLVPETWVASPDWLRIGGLIDAAATGAQVVRKPAIPRAPAIGQIARLRVSSGTPPPTPSIIYVHPPVA